MYNRYLDGAEFHPVEEESAGVGEPAAPAAQGDSPGLLSQLFSPLLGRLGGKKNAGGASGILHGVQLDALDKGDLLLILILLYLFWESEDEELLIILGLLLFTGL
jgi:hypothetical protein